MKVNVFEQTKDMAVAAAADAAATIKQAIAERGEARVIIATGASQFEFLQNLTSTEGIDWGKVTAFHLDEYVGLPISHKASFRAYLRERFVGALPAPLKAFVEVNGEATDLDAECERLKDLLDEAAVDVACVGIGENAHLAFNDPPADFETEEAFLVVDLDEACRKQQLGEGWFPTFDDVPKRALTMSVPQIMKSRRIVCTVPDARKADAVKCSVEGPVSPKCPASIMQQHLSCALYLDSGSASKLKK
jgi:glucosamine-6-phosphate deaminase